MIWLGIAAFAQTPQTVEGWRSSIDWEAAGDEVAAWLSAYLKIDTVAPPGNERDGAEWLKAVSDELGIESKIYDHGNNRASFAAFLRGDGSKRPLCLLSHIDVVPSDTAHWAREPLSGAIEHGKVWGRGALDMKGMTVVELGTLAWLKRLDVPLKRDVVLLAVADEEVDGMGMQRVLGEQWPDIDCEYLINEGGLGIKDGLFDGQTLHAISVAEKGTLWARLYASGPAGHGSRIEPGEAPARLREAMDRVEKNYRVDSTIGPELEELLRRAGDHQGGISKTVLNSKFLRNLIVKPKLKAVGATAAVITDTAHLTGMGGAKNVNVVPSEVWAQYDCRLRPGTSPEQQLKRLEATTAKMEGVRWEVVNSRSANGNPWDDPFFHTIAHYAVEDRPHAVAGPVLSPGFTDSIFARTVGVKAFGYVPFELTQDEAQTMHGHDEHVSIQNLREGTRRLFSIVSDFATQ